MFFYIVKCRFAKKCHFQPLQLWFAGGLWTFAGACRLWSFGLVCRGLWSLPVLLTTINGLGLDVLVFRA